MVTSGIQIGHANDCANINLIQSPKLIKTLLLSLSSISTVRAGPSSNLSETGNPEPPPKQAVKVWPQLCCFGFAIYTFSSPHPVQCMLGMGSAISALRQLPFDLQLLNKLISSANADFSKAQKRVSQPQLPSPSTTESFWQKIPLFPELVNIKSKSLPSSTDIVIIGSGIAGASVAYTILNECETAGIKKRVVLLEAREICSGATGRNGGHIKATPYHAYPQYKARFGAADARKLCEFETMHLPTLLEIAQREELDAAEVREVDTVDIFTDCDTWEKAQVMVQELQDDVPSLAEGISVHTAAAAQEVHHPIVLTRSQRLLMLFTGIWRRRALRRRDKLRRRSNVAIPFCDIFVQQDALKVRKGLHH